MWCQGLSNVSKKFMFAALLFSSMAAVLFPQESLAACRGASAGGSASCENSVGANPGVGGVLSEAMFNNMFPNRNPLYPFNALFAAASTFPTFATTGDIDTRKREVAAFLAHVAHETGNLEYVEEIIKNVMCDTSWGPPGCSCVPGKLYYGRGPILLSWSSNYCAAGNALGLNLVNDPDLIARDATVAWRTGLWFWMTQPRAGQVTAHDAIVTGAGFGETIRTFNGALECNGQNPAQMQNRINNYLRFTSMLGVSPGSNLGC